MVYGQGPQVVTRICECLNHEKRRFLEILRRGLLGLLIDTRHVPVRESVGHS